MGPSGATALAALIALSAVGCTVDRAGLQIGEGGTPPVDGGPVDGFAELDAGELDMGSEDLSAADLGPRTDLGTDMGSDPCADGGVRVHRSCRERRDDICGSPAVDGLYEIDVDGPGPRAPIQVYCDMSIAGGGWTLVARSYGGTAPFGWTSPFGAPDMDSARYSLGLGDALEFTEVLVGMRGTGKRWDAHPVYRFTVPPNFVTTYATTAYAIPDLAVVQGPCTPPVGGPSMLRYTGHTSASDLFFFGDTAAFTPTGLIPYAFSLASDRTCDISGALGGRFGMIMVR